MLLKVNKTDSKIKEKTKSTKQNKENFIDLYINYDFNNWYTIETQPIDPFVLEGLPLFTNFPPEDRDHTDSRRIKPNSRTLLMDEQSNPSKLLPPEDRMNRHRYLNKSNLFRLV